MMGSSPLRRGCGEASCAPGPCAATLRTWSRCCGSWLALRCTSRLLAVLPAALPVWNRLSFCFLLAFFLLSHHVFPFRPPFGHHAAERCSVCMHAPAGAECRRGKTCCLLQCSCLSISFLLLQCRAAVLSLAVVSPQGALQMMRHCSRAAFAELRWEKWGERVDGEWAAPSCPQGISMPVSSSRARSCKVPRSLCRLKLDENVSLEKIKFFCMDHDGGSMFVYPVEKEILQAQKKVGRKMCKDNFLHCSRSTTPLQAALITVSKALGAVSVVTGGAECSLAH